MSRTLLLEFGPDHADHEGAVHLVTFYARIGQQEMPGSPQPIRAIWARGRTCL
jgi:hypothetical protein